MKDTKSEVFALSKQHSIHDFVFFVSLVVCLEFLAMRRIGRGLVIWVFGCLR
jgi:hypothetical protein